MAFGGVVARYVLMVKVKVEDVLNEEHVASH